MSKHPAGISRGALYGLVFAYLGIIAVVFAGIAYTNYVQRESNRKWCEIIRPLDEAYITTPPTTEVGKKIASSLHGLNHDFGC